MQTASASGNRLLTRAETANGGLPAPDPEDAIHDTAHYGPVGRRCEVCRRCRRSVELWTSQFFGLLTVDGPKYRVFTDVEIGVWRDWVPALPSS
jgi:hypothetical protein